MLDELQVHLASLRREGRIEVWTDSTIEPGQEWESELRENLEKTQLFLLLVSPELLASDYIWGKELKRALELQEQGRAWVVPIILRTSDWQNTPFAKLQVLPRDGRPVSRWENRDEAYLEIVQGIRKLVDTFGEEGTERSLDVLASEPERLLVRISLRNIRCFENLDLDLLVDGQPAPLLLLVGENSSGKSTLLRAIAVGLANASDAAALVKQLPGGLIRHSATQAAIELEFYDSQQGVTFRTELVRGPNGEELVLPSKPASGRAPFVCAYGTGRSREATSSHKRYSLHQALLPLFDDNASLQNPELILLRQEPYVRAQLEKRLLQVLMLDNPEHGIIYGRSGAQLHTPTGDHALRTLSDGYRSTTQWLLDFLSWAIYADRLRNGDPIGGMLIVDEIEQHLHPRWQRHILQRLKEQFPDTQIFTSTHTPLVAAATADVSGALLVRLEADSEGKVSARRVEREEVVGLRADQVLAEIFGLYTSRSPGSQDDISRYAELLGKEQRSSQEDAALETLRQQLEATLRVGENEVQQKVEAAMENALRGMLAAFKPEVVDLETKRQLKELFERVGE